MQRDLQEEVRHASAEEARPFAARGNNYGAASRVRSQLALPAVRDEERRRLRTPKVTGTSKLSTVTLTDLLRQTGAPPVIDYLSLDVEGFESEVLLGFDLDGAYTIYTMTIERPDNALQDKLLAGGYLRCRPQVFRFGEACRVGEIPNLGALLSASARD